MNQDTNNPNNSEINNEQPLQQQTNDLSTQSSTEINIEQPLQQQTNDLSTQSSTEINIEQPLQQQTNDLNAQNNTEVNNSQPLHQITNNISLSGNSSPKSSKKNIIIPIAIILGIAVVIFIAFIIIKMTLFKSEPLYGKWDCSSSTIVLEKNKTFEMYDSNNKNKLNVIGKFTINKKETNPNSSKYTLILKTNNRTINGNTLTDEYTTQYEIAIDKNNKDNMAMMNTISYNLYQCKRVN